MIFRVRATRDTFITDAQKRRVKMTGSNFGAAETLDVYKRLGVSGAIGVAGSSSLARSLLYFDVDQFAALTASGVAPTTGARFWLRMRGATTADTLPSSFTLDVVPMSRSWDEGRGFDVNGFNDRGVCNWDKATSTIWWTTAGGDFLTTTTASLAFDTGLENIDVEVTPMVNAWLTGGLVNNGLMVKLTGSQETDANDYFIKRFYGRTSRFQHRRPFIEARWDDSARDDRGLFRYDQTGSLFLHNTVGGRLTDLPVGSGTLRLAVWHASGVVTWATASRVSQGIYSASFAVPSSSLYSGSVLFDRWGSASYAYMTGAFHPSVEERTPTLGAGNLIAKVRNLRNEYTQADVPRLLVFVRDRDNYRLDTVLTSSMTIPSIVKRAFYRVVDDDTGEEVVPFGTGSVESTRMSYNASGSFFNFRMSALEAATYRFQLLVDMDGEDIVVDAGPRFRVV